MKTTSVIMGIVFILALFNGCSTKSIQGSYSIKVEDETQQGLIQPIRNRLESAGLTYQNEFAEYDITISMEFSLSAISDTWEYTVGINGTNYIETITIPDDQAANVDLNTWVIDSVREFSNG